MFLHSSSVLFVCVLQVYSCPTAHLPLEAPRNKQAPFSAYSHPRMNSFFGGIVRSVVVSNLWEMKHGRTPYRSLKQPGLFERAALSV